MPIKILIVEDDPINVKFMRVVLTRKGGTRCWSPRTWMRS